MPFCQLWKSLKIWWEHKVLSSDKKKKKSTKAHMHHILMQLQEFHDPLKPIYGPLWMCWHHSMISEPIFNKITFKYVLAFQVIAMCCYSNDISVAPNISGATASQCPQNPFPGHKRKSVSVTFVFFKQYFWSCLVHYLWFQMTFGYFQNCKPFSKDSIPLRKSKKYATGSERNPKGAF